MALRSGQDTFLRTLGRRDSTSLTAVQSHFARYGLLDDQVVFLKGFFSETLPASGVQAVAMPRCDGDSFESTYGVLADLYDQVIDNMSMFWQKPREVPEHLSRRSGSSAV